MSVPAPPLLPHQATSTIAIDPFDQNPLDLIQHMHSGVGVLHSNVLVSSDTVIMAAQLLALRNYILPLFHSNLILVSLDG